MITFSKYKILFGYFKELWIVLVFGVDSSIKERQSLSELAQKYELHPNLISTWKKELLEGSSQLFETKRGAKPVYDKGKEARLFQQIGQLQFELDWLKKKYDQHS